MRRLLDRIIKLIKNPFKLVGYLGSKGFLKFIPDKIYLKLMYRSHFGSKLNLNNPKTFGEKIQWLKLYDRKSYYTNLVDKYKVRELVTKKIGNQYLIPLLGVYKSFEEIDFKNLPNQFVLKANNSSGSVFICKDKSKVNYIELKRKIKNWFNKSYFWLYREWPYKNIEPLIICEKYMAESKSSLTDYKIYCFNGQPKYCQVIQDRNADETIDFFDEQWSHMPFTGLRDLPNSTTSIKKPEKYSEMLELAAKLSKGLRFVRVDFYYLNGNIYFGELTFYPQSGFGEFRPAEWNERIGDLIRL